MTGDIPQKTKNQTVSRKIVIEALITAIIIIGSFSIRELYSGNQIINKLLGGVNILFFWLTLFTIYYTFDKWVLNKRADRSKSRIFIKLFLFPIIVISLFFLSLRYFTGASFVIFWILLLLFVWAMNILIKKNGNIN